ncbi:MAG: hypothetical protein HYX74_05050 [Acidobacteria bacterium]|nr:hypothetical protein [Acidobacteriota bacterium]
MARPISQLEEATYNHAHDHVHDHAHDHDYDYDHDHVHDHVHVHDDVHDEDYKRASAGESLLPEGRRRNAVGSVISAFCFLPSAFRFPPSAFCRKQIPE